MKSFWIFYTTTLVLFAICSSILLWIMHPVKVESATLLSTPLPSPFLISSNNQVTSLDVWSPTNTLISTLVSVPNLTALAAGSYDLTTDQYLLQKNIDQRLPMASITKIMTAIISLEHQKSDDRYLVSKAALVGEDSMGVQEGEIFSLKDLLYGLVLRSGNDAAEVLAQNYYLGREKFIDAMNQKAVSLGLTDTHFTNPTGFEGDGDQHTTVHDLLIITKYALEHFPLFANVVSTFSYTITPSTHHVEYDLENETNLITSYPGVKGVKTGYTPEAGMCLVTYLEYGGHHIIAVVLNSADRRGEMKEILDFSLKSLGITPPHHG